MARVGGLPRDGAMDRTEIETDEQFAEALGELQALRRGPMGPNERAKVTELGRILAEYEGRRFLRRGRKGRRIVKTSANTS